MKLIHSYITEVKQEAPKTKVPMFKDPVLIAGMKSWIIATNNRRLKSKQS